MLRYEDIKDISDGRLYGADDKALIGTDGCKGCSHCCESDMGDTIVLTPYDTYLLWKGTGKSFDELLTGFYVEISIIDGIALPHLKMNDGCKFLQNGRCSIHEYRPGICRLFPLGRIYNDKGFDYFIQINECIKKYHTPVRISEWLGISDLKENTDYINKWHRFLQFVRKRINELELAAGYEIKKLREMKPEELITFAGIVGDELFLDEDVPSDALDNNSRLKIIEDYRNDKIEAEEEEVQYRTKEIMKTVLRIVYMENYDEAESFYQQFDKRMRLVLSEMRQI